MFAKIYELLEKSRRRPRVGSCAEGSEPGRPSVAPRRYHRQSRFRYWALPLGVLAACAPPQEPPRAPQATAESGVPAAALDPAQLPSESGFSEAHWGAVSRGGRSARVWMPEAQGPRSVVILLHGAVPSATGRREHQPRSVTQRLITCLAAPALAELDPVIVAPYSGDGQWWKTDDTQFVLGLAAAARKRWPEAAQRIVIMGYSNGGIATWVFARLYPEYFSAAIPMAFDASIVGATPLPVFAIQGDKDELFAIGPIRTAIDALRATGADVTLEARYRAGHMNPCAYGPELALAARWLERHAFPKALAKAGRPQ
jgi:poly(3-hydroxybutyrate) depolymerase